MGLIECHGILRVPEALNVSFLLLLEKVSLIHAGNQGDKKAWKLHLGEAIRLVGGMARIIKEFIHDGEERSETLTVMELNCTLLQLIY